jgi:hypothetical protein
MVLSLNSRPSLVLYLSSTSPANSHHNLYLLSIKPLAILASTIFPSGSSITTLSPPQPPLPPCFRAHLALTSIFHDFTSTPSGHLESSPTSTNSMTNSAGLSTSYLPLAASTQEQQHHQNG